ncbi:TAF RNA polymerase I subunit A [Wolffia australiana]
MAAWSLKEASNTTVKTEPDDCFRATEDIGTMNVESVKVERGIHGAKLSVKNRRLQKRPCLKPLLHEHKRRLILLLDKLCMKHEWRDVSGALSVLLKGTPRGCSLLEDRKHFTLAMEVIRRFPSSVDYSRRIKHIFDVWMGKLPWAKKCPMKKQVVQMELAIFCLMQGNVKEAHQAIKFLSQDRESSSDPHVHLIHGLASFQLWYSELPQEMQVKDFDVFMQPKHSGVILTPGTPQYFGLRGASSTHDSINIQCAEIFAQSNSESSIGDKKALSEGNLKGRVKWAQMDESADEDKPDCSNSSVDRKNRSIFHLNGLDACLLPIKFQESVEDLESRILSHQKLLNQHYMDAVKHTRAALHSNPPILSALHPLIQLLLLGDQVGEALKELDEFIHKYKSLLPLRYKARLLECLNEGRYSELARCYEQIVETDPSHVQSLKMLVDLHTQGNYHTVQLMEYLAIHIDHTEGDTGLWEELASCFLKIQSLQPFEYKDDDESTTRPAHLDDLTSQATASRRIPKALTRAESRATWIYRIKWWCKRHFSMAIHKSDIQAGNPPRLAYKAACACHMYGPEFKYVSETRCRGKQWGSFLKRHRDSSLNLCHILSIESPL